MSERQTTGNVPHNPLEGPRPELSIKLSDGSDERVSIIIVHKDKPEFLNILLQSIIVCTPNNNYEIIVVDNGSGIESQDFLKEIDREIKVIRNEKNLYWSAACNKGVEAADKNSKYYFFLHSDVVITNPAWIDLFINVAETGSGLVGVEMSSYNMQNQKVDFIVEWMVMVTKDCWKSVGPWPEKLPQVGHAFYMTFKALQKGFRPQVMKNSVAHHYRIFGLDPSEYERLTEQAMYNLPQMIREVQSIPVK